MNYHQCRLRREMNLEKKTEQRKKKKKSQPEKRLEEREVAKQYEDAGDEQDIHDEKGTKKDEERGGKGLWRLVVLQEQKPKTQNNSLSVFLARFAITALSLFPAARFLLSWSAPTVIAIGKGCKLLEEWNLALCHGVMVPGWRAVGFYCNNLKTLHVNGCEYFNFAGLVPLREGCESLSTLYIGKFFKPFEIFFFSCKRLEVCLKFA
ncbi:hypothetical protein PIB30_023597 [Stylosanthes scabra]|uniref:Uncharacterized protein n=1 Tax=Stylosanthes scabra TaxID=79078 RepID=A0ABU6Y6M1_9FABA|nr:hypothetical protein [Stylosanthes scabra]